MYNRHNIFMQRINLSFIQYGGLAYGGAQKQAVTLAKILDKQKFSVRYFWSEPALDLYSDFVHPLTNKEYIKQLEGAGVEVVEFKVEKRDISHPLHPWINTDFFEIFKAYQTDLVFSVRAGHTEFPFVHLNLPVVEWNVFGQADLSENLVSSVAVSPWVQKEYVKNGGRAGISKVCFPAISSETSKENLRGELNILPEEVVLGFHQRVDEGIFAEHALRAYKNVRALAKKPTRFLILGGSEKYKNLAEELGVEVGFLPLAMDYTYVSKFLNTLDIFCHSAGLGESVGLAVMEAMIHKLPVVSKKGENNGHVDVIGNTYKVAENQEQYEKLLFDLIENEPLRKEVSEKSLQRASENFSLDSMKVFFEKQFSEVYFSFVAKAKQFKVLPTTIYNQLPLKARIFRALSTSPKLKSFTLKAYRKFKDIRG